MADTTTKSAGIHDENEFYSQHYFSEIFTEDIRDTIARWREAAEAPGGTSEGAWTGWRQFDLPVQKERLALTMRSPTKARATSSLLSARGGSDRRSATCR